MGPGSLSGGGISVSADPICVGDASTFTVSEVSDTGGEVTSNCDTDPTPPCLSHDWVITLPDGTTATGTGMVATISQAEPAGVYTCSFTVSRECATLIVDTTETGEPAAATMPDWEALAEAAEAKLREHVPLWQSDRNSRFKGIAWQFQTADARTTLGRLYRKTTPG